MSQQNLITEKEAMRRVGINDKDTFRRKAQSVLHKSLKDTPLRFNLEEINQLVEALRSEEEKLKGFEKYGFYGLGKEKLTPSSLFPVKTHNKKHNPTRGYSAKNESGDNFLLIRCIRKNCPGFSAIQLDAKFLTDTSRYHEFDHNH